LYSTPGFLLLVFLAGLLFLTLVAVVKIVELERGPLRPFTVKPGKGGLKALRQYEAVYGGNPWRPGKAWRPGQEMKF